MSFARRERRKLLRDLSKSSGQNLEGIITPQMGEELRRRHLQKLKNEEIVGEETDVTENPNYLNSEGTSYDSFKSLIVNRDWSNY